MTNPHNNYVGFFSGLVGGFIKYYTLTGTILVNTDYFFDLLKSGFTALICGAAGVLGKYLVTEIYGHFKGKKKDETPD